MHRLIDRGHDCCNIVRFIFLLLAYGRLDCSSECSVPAPGQLAEPWREALWDTLPTMRSTIQGAALLLLLPALATTLVNKIVPEPYMDEFFHVRQTQAYCAGRWAEWDPKITTFPGLYLIGALAGRAVRAAAAAAGVHPPLCGTGVLRWVSTVLGAACLPAMLSVARFAGGDPGAQTAVG